METLCKFFFQFLIVLLSSSSEHPEIWSGGDQGSAERHHLHQFLAQPSRECCHRGLARPKVKGTYGEMGGLLACYAGSLGSNPDISQKCKMGHLSKEVANTHTSPQKNAYGLRLHILQVPVPIGEKGRRVGAYCAQ